MTFSSRTTAAVESQEKTKHERNDWVWIITLLGVFVLVFISIVMYRIKIKGKYNIQITFLLNPIKNEYNI